MWVQLPELEDDDVDVVVREVHFETLHHVELACRILLSFRLKQHVLHALQREESVLNLVLPFHSCHSLHFSPFSRRAVDSRRRRWSIHADSRTEIVVHSRVDCAFRALPFVC